MGDEEGGYSVGLVLEEGGDVDFYGGGDSLGLEVEVEVEGGELDVGWVDDMDVKFGEGDGEEDCASFRGE